MIKVAGVVWRAEFSEARQDPYEWLDQRSIASAEAFRKGEPGLLGRGLTHSGVFVRVLSSGIFDMNEVDGVIRAFLEETELGDLRQQGIVSALDVGVIVGTRECVVAEVYFSAALLRECARRNIDLCISCYPGSDERSDEEGETLPLA